MLKFETLFTPGNENLYHHWLLYECNPAKFENFLKLNSIPKPGPCFPQFAMNQKDYDTKWLDTMGICDKISLGWAVGGDAVT